MNPMDPIDDVLIQEKVESLAGKGTRVVDCEKSTTFKTNEIVLVNGYPVPLIGDEGAQLKRHLLEGQIPSGELLNVILIRAGILTAPVELETTFNVKSTTKTTELLTLRDKNGLLLDERIKEVEEDNEFSNKNTERWQKEEEKNEEELRRLGRRVEKLYPEQAKTLPKCLLKRETSQDSPTNNSHPTKQKQPPLNEQQLPNNNNNNIKKEGDQEDWNGESERKSTFISPSLSSSSIKSEHHGLHNNPSAEGKTMRSETLPNQPSSSALAQPEIFRSISDALSSTPLTRTPSDYNVSNPCSPNKNNNTNNTNNNKTNSLSSYPDKCKYKHFHPSLNLVPTELNGKPIRFTYETFV